MLAKIVRKNLRENFSALVKTTFNHEVAEYFKETVKSLCFLKYVGELSTVPVNADVGSIYKVEGSYYLFYEREKYKRILTIEDINEIIANFYTKEEINSIISGLYTKMDEFKVFTLSGIEEMENASNNFVTQTEFVEKFSEYAQQINEYRQSYEDQILSIRQNWDEEIEKINEFKTRNENAVSSYEKKYSYLKEIVDNQWTEISSFVDNVNTVLSSAFGDLNLLKESANNLNNTLCCLVSSYQETTANYDELLNEMSNTITILSGKIDDLMAEDQRILEL